MDEQIGVSLGLKWVGKWRSRRNAQNELPCKWGSKHTHTHTSGSNSWLFNLITWCFGARGLAFWDGFLSFHKRGFKSAPIQTTNEGLPDKRVASSRKGPQWKAFGCGSCFRGHLLAGFKGKPKGKPPSKGGPFSKISSNGSLGSKPGKTPLGCSGY